MADTEETPLSRGQEVTPACEKALVLWNALHWCERHTRIHMTTQLNAKKACKSIYNRKSSQEKEMNAQLETKKRQGKAMYLMLMLTTLQCCCEGLHNST